MVDCETCVADRAFLQTSTRPRSNAGGDSVRVVDLFSGCGGMSLGLAEAARRRRIGFEAVLAVDTDPAASAVYAKNLGGDKVRTCGVEALFDGRTSTTLTSRECEVKAEVGSVHVLAGGPPCQGHSDLNNHTRREDPRNALYALMARAAQVLEPRAVIIENVPAVINDRASVVRTTAHVLNWCGYSVADDVIDLWRLGVPQRRRRHLLLAVHSDCGIDAGEVLSHLEDRCGHAPRTVEWAIRDLSTLSSNAIVDSSGRLSADNRNRIDWLFDNGQFDLPNEHRPPCHRDKDHSYRSMYGRLKWDSPAQTITTGFGSMGQGRFVHPEQRRTITPHEAARLQSFPDFFDFTPGGGRGVIARLIGNAVPPFVTLALGELLFATGALAVDERVAA